MSGLFFLYLKSYRERNEYGMSKYNDEFKEQVVRKMMPPGAQSVAQVSRDTGVSEQTLYNWRNHYRHEGKVVPADPSNPENWSGADKLAVIIETAALNEQALSEYCRKKGLYPEQIARWKEMAISGADNHQHLTRAEKKEWKADKVKAKNLEKELRRKEKALAEAAALLVLKKKAQAIWGDNEDDS
jgi:transposase